MIAWVIAIGLFWVVSAVYLGGLDVRFEGGGGVRQTLGLIATFALFLVVWWLLRGALEGIGPIVGGIIVPTVAAALLLPLLARVGFRIAGVKLSGGGAHAGEGHPGGH